MFDICMGYASVVYNSIRTNTHLSNLDFRLRVKEELLAKSEYIPAKPDRLLAPETSAKVNFTTT